MVNRRRLQVVLILTGTFALGALCGAAAYHASTQKQYAELFSGERRAFENRRAEALARELDLSREQERRVIEIFRRHSAERKRLMRQTFETCGQALGAHKDRIDAEIRAVLSPEQRPRFDELRAEHQRRVTGQSSAGSAPAAP